MLEHVKIENILFLDIETVPLYPSLQEAPAQYRRLWENKARYINKDNEPGEEVFKRAGIFAEFGKIICISTGMIGLKDNRRMLRLKSFYQHDEKDLLAEFADVITRLCQKRDVELCAHNGREFDFPYISRRLLINGIKLPPVFDTSNKKPWEVKHIDTLELWKFGDYKHYTSLDLLASVFNLDSPKSDIDGSQVANVYWNEQNIDRIAAYCRNDVITLAQLILKFKGDAVLSNEEILVLDAS